MRESRLLGHNDSMRLSLKVQGFLGFNNDRTGFVNVLLTIL